MDKAWDIYYAVFRRIEKQLPLLTTIDLQYASPKLLQAENLDLAVPGTYKSGKPVVKITRFVSKLSVIASKQRPRRLAIMGSDGKEYQFLLKGEYYSPRLSSFPQYRLTIALNRSRGLAPR